ncbi:MAG: hypothetical protein GXY75_07155 [Bacteroidales bacterium]|jgi:hypothetical protein|nr:hypothetical protein [Bacteroidales bacterium]
MINIRTRIHDNFSVEFKESFVVDAQQRKNDFAVNTWIFVPNSLDIHPDSYSKEQFYRDVKSNVRLKTPVYLLRDIAGGDAVPLTYLRDAMSVMAKAPDKVNIAEYEYQIKMFCAIAKSSIRDEVQHILEKSEMEDILDSCDNYIGYINGLVQSYRALEHIIDVPTANPALRAHFSFGDEFLSYMSVYYSFKLIKLLEDKPEAERQSAALKEFLRETGDYRSRKGFPAVSANNKKNNDQLIYRYGVLRKYVASDLFVELTKKKDGVAVEQIYYSIAAGMAMVIATVVTIIFQKSFASFPILLFLALIASYMLKDRVKDLMRYYFAHKLGKKYFDNKAVINIKEQKVGYIKEGVDFISESKIPAEVLEMRNSSTLIPAAIHILDEKIILYRKLVTIDSQLLAQNSVYPLTGINDIFRLHFKSFCHKMDNPEQWLDLLEQDGRISRVKANKFYYINIITQVKDASESRYHHFRVKMTRDGIKDIENLSREERL